MTFCTNCGKELKESYNFCPKCGKEIEKEVKESKSDSLYEEIVKFVVENNKASVSMIQKEFKLSYTKALKMINLLEENGVVGPANGSKGREILINNKTEENEEVKSKKVSNNIRLNEKIKHSINNIMNTSDTTNSYDEKDVKDNMVLAILSYIGLLAFIPYFVHSDSKFVKYHATQGMNLLIVWGAYTLLDGLLSLIKVSKVVVDFGSMVGTKIVTPIWISLPMDILGIILFAISIVGIVYACQGKAKELPLIDKIKIVK